MPEKKAEKSAKWIIVVFKYLPTLNVCCAFVNGTYANVKALFQQFIAPAACLCESNLLR